MRMVINDKSLYWDACYFYFTLPIFSSNRYRFRLRKGYFEYNFPFMRFMDKAHKMFDFEKITVCLAVLNE